MHVGQSNIAPAVTKRKSFVIDAQLVQDGRVQVVNGERIDNGVRAKLVGFSIRDSAFEAATSHENRIAADMMISASDIVDRTDGGCPSHFASPQHNGLIQKAALMQVCDQRRNGLFCNAGVLFVIHFQMRVLVPWRVVAIEARAGDLDESDTGLDESSCSQGLGCIEPLMLVRGVHAVHLLVQVSRCAAVVS